MNHEDNKLKEESLSLSYFPINYQDNTTDSQTVEENPKSSFNSIFGSFPLSENTQDNKLEMVRKMPSEKEFRCEEIGCDKKYKTKENLKLHILNIHLGLKPYECGYCSRRFSHRNGKTYHERKFHMNYLPYKCSNEGCEKNFANKSSLNYHTKFHHKNVKFVLTKMWVIYMSKESLFIVCTL